MESDCIELSEEYTLLLQLSEIDVANGNVISQSEIDKSDLKWLKEKSFGFNCIKAKKIGVGLWDNRQDPKKMLELLKS